MQEESKRTAAVCAANYVKDGMIIGLGTGSTATFFIKKIGELVASGLSIHAVSTSEQSSILAKKMNIPLLPVDQVDHIDLTIDGADEVDPLFNGIKGGGGALLFEKIVARSSKQNIWIVDKSKLVSRLGRFPVPVEIVPFGYTHTLKKLEELQCKPVLRKTDDHFYLTDSKNYIADLHFNTIMNPEETEKLLSLIPGVVETGLFIGIAGMVIVGDGDQCKILQKPLS